VLSLAAALRYTLTHITLISDKNTGRFGSGIAEVVWSPKASGSASANGLVPHSTEQFWRIDQTA